MKLSIEGMAYYHYQEIDGKLIKVVTKTEGPYRIHLHSFEFAGHGGTEDQCNEVWECSCGEWEQRDCIMPNDHCEPPIWFQVFCINDDGARVIKW